MDECSERFVKEFLREQKIGFIGAGNMAQAIAAGLIGKGLVNSADIHTSAPSDSNLKWWREKSCVTTHVNDDIVRKCGVIFLAMKPQFLREALDSIEKKQVPQNENPYLLFISVLAGVQTDTLEQLIHSKIPFARVVRVLPNTPLHVSAGCSVICRGTTATETEIKIVKAILSQCGSCVEVKENLMDAAGAISGCGPAFMYLLIEAMADGGVQMGLPRDMAQSLAAETMRGAAQMVIQTGRHPGKLKDEVCSPGGTTIAGIVALEKNAVRSAMITAIEASTKRSLEMGRKC